MTDAERPLLLICADNVWWNTNDERKQMIRRLRAEILREYGAHIASRRHGAGIVSADIQPTAFSRVLVPVSNETPCGLCGYRLGDHQPAAHDSTYACQTGGGTFAVWADVPQPAEAQPVRGIRLKEEE